MCVCMQTAPWVHYRPWALFSTARLVQQVVSSLRGKGLNIGDPGTTLGGSGTRFDDDGGA